MNYKYSTMKNKTIILSVFFINYFLIIACQPTQNVETSTPKIKMVQVYKINTSTGEKTLTSISEYDKNGNETKQTTSGSNNSKTIVYFEYDANGNLIKSTDNEGVRLESIYKNDLIIEEKSPYGKTVFEYNDKGDLISETEYDNEGKFDKSKFKEYTYDGDKITKIETFVQRDISAKKQLEVVEVFSYNKNGQVVEEQLNAVYDNRTTTYEYHSNENLKQSIELAFDESEKIIRTYNKDGKKVKEEVYRRKAVEDEFQLSVVNEQVYNEFGYLVTRKHSRDGKLHRHEEMVITYY